MASQSWESEFQTYGWTSNVLTPAQTNIMRATQMAWAKTSRIGCGVKFCPTTTSGGYYPLLVVCQYRYAGNFIMQNIYTSGTTCSACPSGTSCEATSGLCV